MLSPARDCCSTGGSPWRGGAPGLVEIGAPREGGDAAAQTRRSSQREDRSTEATSWPLQGDVIELAHPPKGAQPLSVALVAAAACLLRAMWSSGKTPSL